jgi:hypothetical protein
MLILYDQAARARPGENVAAFRDGHSCRPQIVSRRLRLDLELPKIFPGWQIV